MKLQAYMLWSIIISVSFVAANAQQGRTYVSGHVYDGANKPLSNANVSIFPLESALNGTMPSVSTDKQGFYEMDLPAIGKVRLIAEKKSEGYPNTFFSLFASDSERDPVVNLTTGAELSGVDIHLGPADGIVEISILDAQSGDPIRSAELELRREDRPEVFFNTSAPDGYFTSPLPPVPISVHISAPGYVRWSSSSSSSYLNIKSGDHKSIRAQMIPLTVGHAQ